MEDEERDKTVKEIIENDPICQKLYEAISLRAQELMFMRSKEEEKYGAAEN